MNRPGEFQELENIINLQVGGLRFVEVENQERFNSVKEWLLEKGAQEVIMRTRTLEGAEEEYSQGVLTAFFLAQDGAGFEGRIARLFPEIPVQEREYVHQHLAEDATAPGILFAKYSPDLIQELQGRRNRVHNVLSERGVPIFVFFIGESVSAHTIPPDLFSVRSGPNIGIK